MLSQTNKVSFIVKTTEEIIKVLLIEDNPADTLLVKKILAKIKNDKFELVKAEFLHEGLDCLKSNNFDVILLDLSLPDSWGLDSLREVQKITAEIPIIVLTGIQDKANALAALREGAQDYLIKDSISADLLAKSINYAIERQQNAEKIRQSEACYRGVVEDQTELICRFLPDGTLTFVNQVFWRYFGLSEEYLTGQNLKLVINPEDIHTFESHIESLDRTYNSTSLELRAIAFDGKIYWQQWNIRAIFQGDKITEYQAVGRDISDRKQAELDKVRLIASLHESEERFRTMANTAPVLIWMSDANGQATFFNQSWLDFTGYTLEQALINGWLANIHPDERLTCLNNYNLARQNRCQTQMEYRMLHDDGKYHWLLSNTAPRFNRNGKFVGFISSCIDISERKNAEKLISQQAERDRILAQITQRIHESLDLEIIARATVTEIEQFFQVERLMMTKITSPKTAQVLATALMPEWATNSDVSLSPQQIKLDWQHYLSQLEQGKVVTIEEKPYSELVVKSITPESALFPCFQLLVPIIVEKKLWGLLVAEQFSESGHWQKMQIELLPRITVQIGIAIQKSELYQQVEQLAVIDSLTGIANRRKFDRYIDKEWRRLAREKAPLSLILCDLDYFKLYNDTYGHQAGDRCLHKIAQAIRQAIKRPADLAARYGGEELAIILPNTTPEGAKKVAEKISLQVKALQIPHINSPIDIYLTVSIGVAGFVPCHNSSPRMLIEIADRALYHAKELGRDRVVLENGYDE